MPGRATISHGIRLGEQRVLLHFFFNYIAIAASHL
jgi:hypothetical protein